MKFSTDISCDNTEVPMLKYDIIIAWYVFCRPLLLWVETLQVSVDCLNSLCSVVSAPQNNILSRTIETLPFPAKIWNKSAGKLIRKSYHPRKLGSYNSKKLSQKLHSIQAAFPFHDFWNCIRSMDGGERRNLRISVPSLDDVRIIHICLYN